MGKSKPVTVLRVPKNADEVAVREALVGLVSERLRKMVEDAIPGIAPAMAPGDDAEGLELVHRMTMPNGRKLRLLVCVDPVDAEDIDDV